MGELEHVTQWIAKGSSKRIEQATITRIHEKQGGKRTTGKAAATVYYETSTGSKVILT